VVNNLIEAFEANATFADVSVEKPDADDDVR